MKPWVRSGWKVNRWQVLVGPAHLIDGLVGLLTFGFVESGLTTWVYIRELKHTIANRPNA